MSCAAEYAHVRGRTITSRRESARSPGAGLGDPPGARHLAKPGSRTGRVLPGRAAGAVGRDLCWADPPLVPAV